MNEGKLKYKLKPIRIRSESGTEDVYYPIQYKGMNEEAIRYAERELIETEEDKANGIRKLKEYKKNEGELKYKLKPIRIRSESGTEDVYYPVQYEDLPEEAIRYAERELNETEENKANGLRNLREYMKRENLNCPDDRILINVLRHSKYNFKKSEAKLKQFLKLHQFASKKLSQIPMNTISSFLEEFVFVALPYRDKHGRGIVYTYPSPNFDKYNHEDILICGIVSLLYFLQFPMTSVYGIRHLGECSTPYLPIFYPIFKVLKMSMSALKEITIRIARVDLYNEHFLCRCCMNVLRPFMPDKINKRVMFHGSGFDSVHKIFHPDILPYEIGGTVGPLSIKHYKEDLMCFIERLRDENSAKDV